MTGIPLRPWPRHRMPVDLTGQRFGLVTVLRMVPNIGNGPRAEVRCDCGSVRVVLVHNLKTTGKGFVSHRLCRRPANDT